MLQHVGLYLSRELLEQHLSTIFGSDCHHERPIKMCACFAQIAFLFLIKIPYLKLVFTVVT